MMFKALKWAYEMGVRSEPPEDLQAEISKTLQHIFGYDSAWPGATGKILRLCEAAALKDSQDTCARIQMLTGMDDSAWKARFGNDGGLYGLFKANIHSVFGGTK